MRQFYMPNQMFNKLQSDNNIPTPQHNSSHAMVNYMWHLTQFVIGNSGGRRFCALSKENGDI